jgi:hypothetical protein
MDVVISGVRYREALKTTDRREAATLEKKRVGEIQQGKGVSKSGREFARKPFTQLPIYFWRNASRTSRNGLCSLSGIC